MNTLLRKPTTLAAGPGALRFGALHAVPGAAPRIPVLPSRSASRQLELPFLVPAALHKETPGHPKFSCLPPGADWAQPGPGGAQHRLRTG